MARDDPNRGGGGGMFPRKPTPEEVAALATLCSFVVWAAEDNAMYGARRAAEAVQALSTLTGIAVPDIERVAKPRG